MPRIRRWLPALGTGLKCPSRPPLTLADALALTPEEALVKELEAWEDMKKAWRISYKLWLSGCACHAAGRPFDRAAANAIHASLEATMRAAHFSMRALDKRMHLAGRS